MSAPTRRQKPPALAPTKIAARIEKYRKGTLTIQIIGANGRPVPSIKVTLTETIVLSGPQRGGTDLMGPAATDWNTTPEGEAAQAAYAAQFYTVLFSHPNVQAITWWDLSDKNAWGGAPAGLLHRDMTPKPAHTALMALIRGQWWTRASGRTDTHGAFPHRVFYADYTLTVTVHLP